LPDRPPGRYSPRKGTLYYGDNLDIFHRLGRNNCATGVAGPGFPAMVGGLLASYMTACIAGILL
jgi:hypothetical protein